MMIILNERWNIYNLAFEKMSYFTKSLGIIITLEKSIWRGQKRGFGVLNDLKWPYRKWRKIGNITKILKQINEKETKI